MANRMAKCIACIFVFLFTLNIFSIDYSYAQAVSGIDNTVSDDNIVKILGIDPTAYPKVKVNIFVDEICAATGDLVRDDFKVAEDGNEVAIDNFYFTGRASGQKLDLAVVFDETDTMDDEIDAMQSNVDDLTNKIKSSDIDARYSLVTFKNEVLPRIEWTDDADSFKQAVGQLRASGGNYQRPEDPLGGVAKALSFGFRPDAQKIIIVITDEPSMQKGDGWSNSPYHEDDVKQHLLNSGAMLVAVSPDFRVGAIPSNIPRSDLPLYADMRELAQSSGGLWIDIYCADFSVILDQLEEIITGTYVIEYTSPNLTPARNRTVSVSVNAPECVEGGTSSSYIAPAIATGPDDPPVISALTSDKTSPQGTGSVITWTAKATDPNGDQVLYRFFLDYEPVTDWTEDATWTWTAPAEVGMYRVEAQVRDGTHAGPNGMDDRKLVSFEITGSNEPPTISALTPDKASPQEPGSAITWTAEADDPDGDQVLYRFFLDDEPMTDWMTENSWTWTVIELGLHWYEVRVRDGKHAGPDGMDDRVLSNVEISSPNRPPAINSLETDKLSPQEAGAIIFWTATATDAEDDDLEYRFLLNGGTVQDWSSDSTWEWSTSVSDIGSHEIEVEVRDGKHDLDGDDSRSNEFEVKASAVSFVEFNRTYGGFVYQGLFSAEAVQSAPDGGYILAFEAFPLWGSVCGGMASDAWLIKTDSEGHEVWSSVLGGEHTDMPFSIQPTPDGGYVLAGRTYSRPVSSMDAWLIKIDSEGREVWSRTFGGLDREESACACSVRPTPDGGYILAGFKRKTYYGSTDALLIKTDSEGREVWSRTFGGASDDSVKSVLLTLDGGYVLAGSTSSFGSGGTEAWFIKTDSEGREVWSRTFGGVGSLSSVQLTLDGGYILAGSNALLIKTDSEGHVVWNRTFGRDSSVCSVRSTPDGGYILAGSGSSLGSRGNDPWLIKIDSEGNIDQLPSGGQAAVRTDASGDLRDAIEAFKNQNEMDGLTACINLGEIGEPAVDPLIEALKDENWRTRYYAAYALGEIGDPRAVDPLIETREDENRWVRGSAATALGEISGSGAVDNLIETLKDEDSETRGWAAVFLGAARDPRAVFPLIDALKDEDGWVREVAAMALGKIGDPKAVDPLIDALKDEDDWVRQEAARALGEIGDVRAVDPLIEALEDEFEGTRGYAAEALGKIGDPKAADPLTKVQTSDSTYSRMAVTRALQELGAD
jgi:HEAT repeat protein